MVNRLLTAIEADLALIFMRGAVVPGAWTKHRTGRKMANQARKKSSTGHDTASRATRSAAVAPAPQATRDEAQRPRSTLGQLKAELERVKEELLVAQRRVIELEHRVDEDVLLPVLNRRGFDRELERTLAYVSRHGTDVCLIFIDLDDFKTVNDVHGHAAGDAALHHLTDILLANVRRSDVVARLGGDEFAIILHRADEAAAQAKADQLQRAIASSGVVFEGKEIPLSLTAGVTRLMKCDDAASALGRADQRMYEGKAARKSKSVANRA